MSKLRIDTEMTGPGTIPAIRLFIGDHQFTMHARTAVDLHHKIGKALCDWVHLHAVADLPPASAGWDLPTRFGRDQDVNIGVRLDGLDAALILGDAMEGVSMGDLARVYHKLGKSVSVWNFDALATLGG